MTAVPDPAVVSRIIREVATAEIMPRFRRLAAHEVSEKSGPHDLVTVADIEAEAALGRALESVAPGVPLVGEEGCARDPRRLEILTRADAAWVVDPVDGTLNFAEGRRTFAVMIALLRQGRTVAAWIHAPASGGEMAIAEKGSGAWSEDEDGNSRRLRVAVDAEPEHMIGALYAGRKRAPEIYDRVQALKGMLRRSSYIRCVAFEYLALAHGRHHVALFTRLMPWDHAPGVLMHAEAGGYSARLDGVAYTPAERKGPLLLAPDDEWWRRIRDFIIGHSHAV